MSTFNIPPPPPTNDMRGPAWQDWFFKLTRALTSAVPTVTDSVLSNQSFSKHNVAPPQHFTATNKDQLLPTQVFAKPQQVFRSELNAVNTSSILASQIFGR